MRAMILAAGRGSRMGNLTTAIPKPLLKVNQRYLIEYAIQALRAIDIEEIVINICYQGQKIKQALGDGLNYGCRFLYSEEEDALETGGGIIKALPLLGAEPFMVLSCDIISEVNLKTLRLAADKLAHLVLVKNPSFKPQGDFALAQTSLTLEGTPKLTYANIGIFHPQLFQGYAIDKIPLIEILTPAIRLQKVSGEYFPGAWHNVGTPQELAALNAGLHSRH